MLGSRYSFFSPPGLVMEKTGSDSASSYQNLREYPSGAKRSCPSRSATSGANANPSVGTPTTMSIPAVRAKSAMWSAKAETTPNDGLVGNQRGDGAAPLGSSRSGKSSTRPSGRRTG